jgi:putative chitinase
MAYVTHEQLCKFFEDTEEASLVPFVDAFNKAFEIFEINTPQRIAMFMAQVGHESAGLTALEENLNYKAEGLTRIFHKYFPTADSTEGYARNPEKIANKVYASRMGNGDEHSGDGYRYRGRGAIQLTGKSNYDACGANLEVDLTANPEYLSTPEGAIMSAAWFWDQRDLNDWADDGDVLTVTKKINGGTIGLEDRKEHYAHALEIFS